MKQIIIIILLLFISKTSLNSQCNCMGGASVGSSLTIVPGASNIGVVKEDNLLVTSFFTYSAGDEYYKFDSKTEPFLPTGYQSSLIGLMVSYGFYDDFTLELETSYFINKEQEYYPDIVSGSGFSHLSIYGKYNVLKDRSSDLEWTLGLGGRLPLNFKEEYIPQNIQSSTGAYGLILLSYLYKNFKDIGLHFILYNRAEFNTKNQNDYLYGSSFINSILLSTNIYDKINGIIEFRGDIRLKDNNLGLIIDQSGWSNFILSPKLSYSVNDINFVVFYDLPLYKYYNDVQLTNKFNAGVNVSWNFDFY